jgi:hypothetical protein
MQMVGLYTFKSKSLINLATLGTTRRKAEFRNLPFRMTLISTL